MGSSFFVFCAPVSACFCGARDYPDGKCHHPGPRNQTANLPHVFRTLPSMGG